MPKWSQVLLDQGLIAHFRVPQTQAELLVHSKGLQAGGMDSCSSSLSVHGKPGRHQY